MKIVQIISRMNLGGTATWINTLDSQLAKDGHEIHLIYGPTFAPEIEADIKNPQSSYLIRGLGKGSGFISSIRAFFAIRGLVTKINPDLVNTHTSKAGFLGRIAVFSIGRKRPALVHTFHGHVLTGYFSKAKSFVIQLTERFLGNLTDLILVAGKQVSVELLDRSVVRSEKLRIVYPGVHYHSNLVKSRKNDSRLAIGWLGRLTNIKRPDRVIEIANTFSEIEFVIGGSGELEDSLRKIAPRNVTFLGWVSPEAFWPKVDIALLTSENEAMPYSLIEAGLQGLPAVTTNVGSTSEVVLDSKTGFVVGQQVDALSQAINKLISNPELILQMGSAAKTWAQDNFSPTKMASLHLRIYQEAIALKK